MVFSSVLFLFYFLPVFFIIYSLLPHKFRNIWALIASLLFYAWGAPIFVFVVSSVIISDFFIVNKIHSSDNHKQRRRLLAVSVIMKVGLLAYFKYANFFVENIDAVLLAFGFEKMRWTQRCAVVRRRHPKPQSEARRIETSSR